MKTLGKLILGFSLDIVWMYLFSLMLLVAYNHYIVTMYNTMPHLGQLHCLGLGLFVSCFQMKKIKSDDEYWDIIKQTMYNRLGYVVKWAFGLLVFWLFSMVMS